MFPEELERKAYRAKNGEFGWTYEQVPQVIEILRANEMGVLGGELWWVQNENDGRTGRIPQRDGEPAVYCWATDRGRGEEVAGAHGYPGRSFWARSLQSDVGFQGRVSEEGAREQIGASKKKNPHPWQTRPRMPFLRRGKPFVPQGRRHPKLQKLSRGILRRSRSDRLRMTTRSQNPHAQKASMGHPQSKEKIRTLGTNRQGCGTRKNGSLGMTAPLTTM